MEFAAFVCDLCAFSGTQCPPTAPLRTASNYPFYDWNIVWCSTGPVSRAGFSLWLADHLLRLASRLAAAEPYSYGGGLLTRRAGGLPSRALARGGG